LIWNTYGITQGEIATSYKANDSLRLPFLYKLQNYCYDSGERDERYITHDQMQEMRKCFSARHEDQGILAVPGLPNQEPKSQATLQICCRYLHHWYYYHGNYCCL
jgi:hypothetical protein